MRSEKICHRCKTVFRGDGYKGNCTKDCFSKESYERMFPRAKPLIREIYNHNCKHCGVEFQNNRKTTTYCGYGCRDLATKRTPEEEKIRKANEKWLNGVKKIPKKPKSFAQLNRESEWKRVWDDESWTRSYNFYRG